MDETTDRFWTVVEVARRYNVGRTAIMMRLARHRSLFEAPRYRISRQRPKYKRVLSTRDVRLMDSLLVVSRSNGHPK